MTTPLRRWLMLFAVTATVVLVCMAFVDRPVADYAQTFYHETGIVAWTARVLGLLSMALILMLGVLLAAGIRKGSGRPMAAWAEMPLLMAWSGVWTLSAAIVLKRLVGRSSPYPWYVRQRVYGYEPLQGTPGFEAFPSATTAVCAALLAVVWIRAPRLRAMCGGLVTLIALALVITNSHWVSDVIAGAFLGASIGWMTVLLRGGGVR